MKTHNFAVIGAGRFGKVYLKALNSLGANITAVVSRSEDSLAQVDGLVSDKTKKTANYDDVLRDKNIDCVAIATPPTTHFELAKKAIEAGKHVLLEKPMVAGNEEAKKLRKIVEKSKSVFMVGHLYVYDDYINYLKKEIDNGEFGKINFVFAEHLYPGPIRNDIGVFWDAGTHKLSVIQHLLNPGKIRKVTGNAIDILGNGLDDFTSVIVEFENGLKACISVSWISPERSRKYIFLGSKAAVFDIYGKVKMKIYSMMEKGKIKRSIYSEDMGNIQPEIPSIKSNDPLSNQILHFIDRIDNNKTPFTNIEKEYEITSWLDRVSREIKLPRY